MFELSECVRHRGPDDNTFWQHGRFSFGHRRLSIIDLASGRQPMASADGHIVITYNGEIYNYRELREELASAGHAFRTSSDTEVLINGYRQWGSGAAAEAARHVRVRDRRSIDAAAAARARSLRRKAAAVSRRHRRDDVRVGADAAQQHRADAARSIRSRSATT